MNLSLFIVVLGGRSSKSNVELHDVRWVIGEKIEDTFSELKSQWIGQIKGLHIDSYKCVKYIDGYKIIVIEANTSNSLNTHSEEESLWFINLGGYDKKSMIEQHEFSLVVAKKASSAKKKAKDNWQLNLNSKHNDDCSGIRNIEQIDNVHSIKKIKNWEIKLIPDPQKRSEKMTPDWYGYKRLDIL